MTKPLSYNPYPTEAKAFKAWLKTNKLILTGRTPDQIASLALACGFPLETICPGVIDQVTLLKRLLTFWENPLLEKWLRVARYDIGMDTEDHHE